MAEKNLQSPEEGRPLSEAAAGTTADVFLEARWLAERLSGEARQRQGPSQRSV